MTYRPEDHGADCDNCFLRNARVGEPVGPEIHHGAEGLVVAEFPKDDEVRVGRPLVGKDGQELERGLSAIGVHRTDLSYTQALCCRPPENNLEKLMGSWQKENKARVKNGETQMPSPFDCCKGRLVTEIRTHSKDGVVNVLTLGKSALRSVTGHAGSILEVRGGPINGVLDRLGRFHQVQDEAAAEVEWARQAELIVTEIDEGRVAEKEAIIPVRMKVLPSLSPGFVLRMMRWTKAFRADLGRAMRWFGGRLAWVDPVVHWNPTPEFFREFLTRFSLENGASCDIETEKDRPTDQYYDPLTDRLRCISISDQDEAVVIHFKSIDGTRVFYTDDELIELAEILIEFLANPNVLKIGHNFQSYDFQVLRQQLGVDTAPIRDTLVMHKSIENELPHRLAYVASVYSDAPSWKQHHTATTAETDEQLGKYCAVDTIAVARIHPKLETVLKLRQQESVVEKDHRVMQMCVGMHDNGMYVNQEKRRWHDVRLLKLSQKYLMRFRAAIGDPKFNPGSATAVRDLLFEKWGLIPPESVAKIKRYTKSGLPSTGDEVILALRTSGQLSPEQVRSIEALRMYRRYTKERGTYILKPRPKHEAYALDQFSRDVDDEGEEDWENPDAAFDAYVKDKFDKATAKQGMVLDDGRIHPDYNLGANTGRLSSSGFNANNVPSHLRDIIEPQPGNVFIYADQKQIQLRIIASFAKAEGFLNTFNTGGDAHAVTAEALFRERWLTLDPGSPEWDAMRQFAKTYIYVISFGAELPTVLATLRSTESPNGDLPYANMTMKECRGSYDAFMDRIPFQSWWDSEIAMYRKQRHLADPTWGRKRDFADGEDKNQILCFRTQASEASIMHDAEFDLLQEIPFKKWGHGTGIITETYDSLIIECPEDKQDYVKEVLARCMKRRAKGFDDIGFEGDAKVMRSWYEPICSNKPCKKQKLKWVGNGYACPTCNAPGI